MKSTTSRNYNDKFQLQSQETFDLKFCHANWKLIAGHENSQSNAVFGGSYGYEVN